MKSIGTILLIVVISLTSIVKTQEWYERGHVNALDWQNFDTSIDQPGRYKYVKYFTRSCRYCRLLKEVEEQLRQQKEWNFRSYSIDCTIHYDLCLEKVPSISSFPFVGIYDVEGNMDGEIRGFYPIDTIRQGFKEIQRRQNQAVGISENVKQHQLQSKQVEIQIELKPDAQMAVAVTQPAKIEKQKGESASNVSENSISQGIKIAIILFGVWMYKKLIIPYLSSESEGQMTKGRTIQIPIRSHKMQNTNSNYLISPFDAKSTSLFQDIM